MDRYRRRRSELSRLDPSFSRPFFLCFPARDSRASSQRRPRSIFRTGQPLETDLMPILLLSFLPLLHPCVSSSLPSSLGVLFLTILPSLAAAPSTQLEIRTEPPALRRPRCALWRTRRKIEIERSRLVHSRILPQRPSPPRYSRIRSLVPSFVFAQRAARARRARTTEDVPSDFRSATSPSIHWRRHTCAHATSTYDVTAKQTRRRTGPPRRRRSYVNLHPLTYTTCVVPDEKLLDASATPYRL